MYNITVGKRDRELLWRIIWSLTRSTCIRQIISVFVMTMRKRIIAALFFLFLLVRHLWNSRSATQMNRYDVRQTTWCLLLFTCS
jgi:hypothetical protein